MFCKKTRRAVASLLIMLIFGFMLFPNTATANLASETVWKIYTGFVDGVERTLILTKNDSGEITPYLKIGDSSPEDLYSDNDVLDAGIDKYGTVQILLTNEVVYWWSYDLTPYFPRMEYNVVPNPSDPEGYMQDIESFVFEGSGSQAVIVGYQTVSGDIYPLPSFDEMKAWVKNDSPIRPSYVPNDTGNETPIPVVSATATPSVTPIVKPTAKSTTAPSGTPTVQPIAVPKATPSATPTVKPTAKSTTAPSGTPIAQQTAIAPPVDPDWDPRTVFKTYSGFVDGVKRTLFLTTDAFNDIEPFLKIGDWNPVHIYFGNDVLDAGLDKYGTIQVLYEDKTVFWWSYDLTSDFYKREHNIVPNPSDPEGYMQNIESFVFEGSGDQAIIVGYKSVSGDIYPLPSFDEMKSKAGFNSSIQPSYVTDGAGNETPKPETSTPSTPVPPTATVLPTSTSIPTVQPTASSTKAPTPAPLIPTATSIPTMQSTMTPTETPTQAPSIPSATAIPTTNPTTAPSETPAQLPLIPTPVPIISTEQPNATAQPTVTPKISKLSIKKSTKKGVTTYSLRDGNKTIIEFALRKGRLTWKAGNKKGSIKGIKYAGFIKKSKNLLFIDKKERVYIIASKTGKKKSIIKKGAKKPLYSSKFIIKVKTTLGSIDVSNR